MTRIPTLGAPMFVATLAARPVDGITAACPPAHITIGGPLTGRAAAAPGARVVPGPVGDTGPAIAPGEVVWVDPETLQAHAIVRESRATVCGLDDVDPAQAVAAEVAVYRRGCWFCFGAFRRPHSGLPPVDATGDQRDALVDLLAAHAAACESTARDCTTCEREYRAVEEVMQLAAHADWATIQFATGGDYLAVVDVLFPRPQPVGAVAA